MKIFNFLYSLLFYENEKDKLFEYCKKKGILSYLNIVKRSHANLFEYFSKFSYERIANCLNIEKRDYKLFEY